MNTIDLRSDTVTRPTAAMLEAMLHAEVGDDVFGEDPTVNSLQAYASNMFGMEAALFCPSGTMANQIAIQIHSSPLSQVICADIAHVYLYEVGGIAKHSAASVRLISGDRGRISASQIAAAINPEDDHFPDTKLVCLENTCNKGGGTCYEIEEIEKIASLCTSKNLALHLDGARLFNAIIAQKEAPESYGRLFDSISICLSKGLGAPVGSLLLGTQKFIRRARKIRKSMGGGMRQIGSLAAAGLYALQHNIERLEKDHQHAALLAATLNRLPYVKSLMPAETNIVVFELADSIQPEAFLNYLRQHGILAVSFGAQWIRFVTHLNIEEQMIDSVNTILKAFAST